MISTGDHKAAFPRGWDTPISSIVRDDFVLQDEWAMAHVTLEDAVSHRSGMPRHAMAWLGTEEPDDRNCSSRSNKTNQAAVRNLRNLPRTVEPRVVFQYGDLMYITLSHVVETVTDAWLGDVLRRRIWQPLGMRSTYLSYRDARRSSCRLATGYFWDDEAGEYVAVDKDRAQFSSGAAGVISSAADYAKWVRCLLRGAAPFSEATHRDIRTPRMLQQGPGGGMLPGGWGVGGSYSLGWEVATFHGQDVYKHDGGTQGFGANVLWMPGVRFGVVTFANAADTGNIVEELLTQRLMEDRLGVPPQDRRDDGQEAREELKQRKRDFDNATGIIYANRGADPPSFAVDYNLLAGTYSHPGYGAYTFSVEKSTIAGGRASGKSSSPQQQLVAIREDLIVPSRMVLRHVVGAYWVAYVLPVVGSDLSRSFYAAKFEMGVDGKPRALEVTWRAATDRLSGVATRFERVVVGGGLFMSLKQSDITGGRHNCDPVQLMHIIASSIMGFESLCIGSPACAAVARRRQATYRNSLNAHTPCKQANTVSAALARRRRRPLPVKKAKQQQQQQQPEEPQPQPQQAVLVPSYRPGAEFFVLPPPPPPPLPPPFAPETMSTAEADGPSTGAQQEKQQQQQQQLPPQLTPTPFPPTVVSQELIQQLHLDANALYVILSNQSANNVCHWVLYLHISARLGWAFHISNLGVVPGTWEYRCDESCDMTYSPTAVAAVKVAGDMVPEMHDALRRRIGLHGGRPPVVRLEDTPRFGQLSCRTWVLQALYELDNEGYISVLPGYLVEDVAEEAASLAAANRALLRMSRAQVSELRKEINSACCAL
ncbi:Beta-lactamase/transpeptidase-like protein [Cordyceps fumosorosea ARSEF 2679]|uniref:Beta-lactamase/transpeptidase-like protein n=1 Tax=Cordyceps fumosorosea (strain ARSEF 2679) TaxID=1081104 RepID=A0A167Q4F2_CORFA|nr:Beta-lactamase/transpeptidase-like protein [Cordyceps fumosorosea ARSEF 2679]OAA57276.1 Beta-lactamase/transpeptidase-like protein [Cordyceps fumosorosea ARSEF 2679]